MFILAEKINGKGTTLGISFDNFGNLYLTAGHLIESNDDKYYFDSSYEYLDYQISVEKIS